MDTGPRSELHLEPDLLSAFQRCREAVAARAQLVWAEHCTECAMPGCFVTCSLYAPRPDLKCRRLVNGLEALFARAPGGQSIPLTRVAFRRWGKLEARGYPGLMDQRRAKAIEALGEALQGLANARGLPYGLMRRTLKPLDLARERLAHRLSKPIEADGFVVEAINGSDHPRSLALTIRPDDTRGLFQRTIQLASGYNLVTVPASEWAPFAHLSETFLVQLAPQDEGAEALTFGVLDFVKSQLLFGGDPSGPREAGPSAVQVSTREPEAPAVKCVVWDLDDTIWSGTLIEDGIDALRLKPAAVTAIKELDRRGILHSILSKNSPEEAEAALRRFGLWEYFLFPQISWAPKSTGLPSIAQQLNVNADTFLFIDDQPFERAEMAFAHPHVEVLEAERIDTLLDHPRLAGNATAEASRRRLMYMEEQTRTAAACDLSVPGDIGAFLRQCDLRLELADLGPDNIGRVFELTERTNQLNYSGERLARQSLEALTQDEGRLPLVLSAADRYGDYGIIGFAQVAVPEWEVEHFFMSCRVQRKKVDHQFFQHLMAAAGARGANELRIRYRQTAKNTPSRAVLEADMGLSMVEEGGRAFFRTATAAILPDTGIVQVIDRSKLGAPASSRSVGVAG